VSATGVVHQRVSPATLGVVRAVVFLMWLAVVVPDPLSFLGRLPDTLFKPVGPMMLVPRDVWLALLDPVALDAFKGALIVLLVLSAIGVRPYRPIALAAVVMLTIHQGLVRSFTFTNHEELALLVCAYVLVLFPAADGFAWPPRRVPSRPAGTYSAALLAMTLLLLLPYCGIAAHRIASAAPDVFVGESLPYWLASLSGLDRDGWGVGPWLLGHPALVTLLKAGFVMTTAFELLAPLCLILPRFRRVWIVVVVGFHVVNWFTLNLFFWQNALLVLLLVSDTEAVVTKLRAITSRQQIKILARPANTT
jgi:hypothetical protein